MSANTEEKLRSQAQQNRLFRIIPQILNIYQIFISEKTPTIMGTDGLCTIPSLAGSEEGEHETPSECKTKQRFC